MPLREERHPRRQSSAQSSARSGGRLRGVLRWLPEVVVLVLVAVAFATQGLDLSNRIFGDPGAESPAEVQPPEGLDLVPEGTAPPVASSDPGDALDPVAVRRALAKLVADPRMGKHVAVWVSELGSGDIAYRHGTGAVVPASTMKILTSAAALQALGPMTRFQTTVRLSGTTLTLVGGGDPFLMSTRAKARGLYPERADLQTLAERTATALRARGLRQVRLGYDASLFTGPAVNPAWPANYLPDDVVPPISALWADEGEGPNGRYVTDPAGAAGRLFAKALAREGIAVTGPVRMLKAASTAVQVATISSAPVGQIAQRTLDVSDNNSAEVLARQVGLAISGDASFTGAAEAVEAVLKGLGVPMAGARIHDGSGLSRKNRLTPETLLAVLRLGASEDHPRLREILTGLPVAGFTGSLQSRFDKGPADAKGRVRAKTGTLTGVHGLAGLVVDADGNRMAFVAVADRVALPNTLAARDDLDRIGAALGACHCGATTSGASP